MNEDHNDALKKYIHNAEAEHVSMVGIDAEGFNVEADGVFHRINFQEEIANANEAREALIKMAKA